MKRIVLGIFHAELPSAPQFGKHFVQCGLNADWSATAFHLSAERFTGNKPNTVSGDFYLVENEEFAGGWIVFTRTYAVDRADPKEHVVHDQDLINEVAAFTCAKHAWEWLEDPLNQHQYLHAPSEDLSYFKGEAPDLGVLSSPDLSKPLALHTYFAGHVHRSVGDKTDYQDVAIGFGELLVGHISGRGYSPVPRQSAGYPCLTIPEARALAHELIRLWNGRAHTAAALLAAEGALRQSIEESGHRDGVDGEPKWVSTARAAIADVHAAIKVKAEVRS